MMELPENWKHTAMARDTENILVIKNTITEELTPLYVNDDELEQFRKEFTGKDGIKIIQEWKIKLDNLSNII